MVPWLVSLALLASPPPDCSHLGVPDAPAASPNDNRTPAGTLEGGVLTLHLVAQRATWYPEGPQGCGVSLIAFAEEGKPAQIPGPLIRVPAGTEVRVTVRNALGIPLSMWGLQTGRLTVQEPLVRDTVLADSTRTISFRATVPGTYYYWASPPQNAAGVPTAQLWSQMVGGLIVDDSTDTRSAERERILIMTRWRGNPDSLGILARAKTWELTAFNGLSWPHTERITATVGDTVRWRVIAANNDGHNMHLHGFYFLVESKGGPAIDTTYAAADRRLMVSELLGPGGTLRLRWIPERAGNWIFHCHLMRHMSAYQRLDRMPRLRATPAAVESAHPGHASEEMAGLVLGITVRPRGSAAGDNAAIRRRTLELFADRRDGVFGNHPGFGFVLQEGPRPPTADSVRIPGSPLFLRRGEPTRIVVHNRSAIPLSVHWHGIELESYSDGVSGWSGISGSIALPIAPGDSFAALMTPPRAGTFIYHVHNEPGEELAAGLYGALVVLAPGEGPDPDRVFVIGEPGPTGHVPIDRPPFVNGTVTPPEQELVVGRTYRFRIVAISASAFYRVRLERDAQVIPWLAVARDGAELPPEQKAEMRGFVAGPGSTRDFEVTPAEPGAMQLSVTVLNPGQPQPFGKPVLVTFRVRAP
jgi:FtsP/CotA-like multicopper oxidase with cupredoxin domain